MPTPSALPFAVWRVPITSQRVYRRATYRTYAVLVAWTIASLRNSDHDGASGVRCVARCSAGAGGGLLLSRTVVTQAICERLSYACNEPMTMSEYSCHSPHLG